MMRTVGRLSLLLLVLLAVSCGGRVDEEAAASLHQAGKDVELSVLPPVVRKGQEVTPFLVQGERLAAGLRDAGFTRIWTADHGPALTPGWKASGKALWRRTAKQARAWLKANPQPGSHTLVTEFLMGTRMVVAVHVLIFDAEGRLAYGRALDSGDGLYMEMAPIGEVDCTNLALAALRQDLSPPR